MSALPSDPTAQFGMPMTLGSSGWYMYAANPSLCCQSAEAFLLSLSLNTLIAPVLHLLTLLPDHPLLPLFKVMLLCKGLLLLSLLSLLCCHMLSLCMCWR